MTVCTNGIASRIGRMCLVLAAGGLVSTTAAAGGRVMRSPVEQLRYGPGIENHPVHVRPSRAVRIPAGWPLDHTGAVTCLTCHRTLPGLREGADPALRGVAPGEQPGVDFCTNCHRADGPQTAAGMHWMAVRVAHVTAEQDRAVRLLGSLDEHSRRCLECHDGVNGGDSRAISGGGHGGSDLKRNHPVGVVYRSHKPRGARTQLKSEHLLPAQVRLPGGKVSCVSCHNLYARDANRLSVPIERSKLCFTCHAMD